MSKYNIPAKKTEYKGIMYDSQLEAKMAMILDQNKVEFVPHVWLQVQMDGAVVFRGADFFLPRQIQPYFVSSFINVIEVKGILTMDDYKRLNAMKKEGISCFIALPQLIDFWSQPGCFLKHRMGKIKKKRTKENNNIDF